jgi:hypothetical protein
VRGFEFSWGERMITERPRLPSAHVGQLLCIGIALVALYAFLQDFMSPDWPAGIVAPILMIGFRGALSAAPEDGVLRAGLWQAALLLIPFMGTYGLLDLFFSSDVPVWLISPVVVAAVWMLFSQVVDIEGD